jgi:hypothetical protein
MSHSARNVTTAVIIYRCSTHQVGHGVIHEDNAGLISWAEASAVIHRRLTVLHQVHRAETRPFQQHGEQLAITDRIYKAK